MKNFYSNNYNRIVLISWTAFILQLWLQYIHLSNLAEASLSLILLIPSILLSYILANRWLPKAIHRKNMNFFIFQFVATTLLMAFMVAVNYQLLKIAEAAGHFPRSMLLADNNTLLVDFLFAAPSSLVINFGFCGLRFYYENIKLQRSNMEAQLQFLQAQINPHFMFNVLNHIHTLMQINPPLASSLLLQYSDILRYQLYKGKVRKVMIQEEIRFIQDIIEIEKLRWGKKIHVGTTWEIENKEWEIAPLLLISFVENAFKYASRTLSGTGFVKILFRQQKESVYLEVENSKPPASRQIKPEDESSGIGLDNTKQRLELLYGENHRLDIQETETTYHAKLELWSTEK